MIDVGNNIKKLRELKNYSQQYMAEQLGISQKSYSNIENSANKLTIATIEEVAKVLNVSFNKILELNAEAIFNNAQPAGGINQLNTAASYNYTNDKAFELYEKLIAEKDLRIKTLEGVKKKSYAQ